MTSLTRRRFLRYGSGCRRGTRAAVSVAHPSARLPRREARSRSTSSRSTCRGRESWSRARVAPISIRLRRRRSLGGCIRGCRRPALGI